MGAMGVQLYWDGDRDTTYMEDKADNNNATPEDDSDDADDTSDI